MTWKVTSKAVTSWTNYHIIWSGSSAKLESGSWSYCGFHNNIQWNWGIYTHTHTSSNTWLTPHIPQAPQMGRAIQEVLEHLWDTSLSPKLVFSTNSLINGVSVSLINQMCNKDFICSMKCFHIVDPVVLWTSDWEAVGSNYKPQLSVILSIVW